MVYSAVLFHSSYYDLGDKNIATTIPAGNMVILVDKPTFEIHFDRLIPTMIIHHHYQQSVNDNPSTPESVSKKVNANS